MTEKKSPEGLGGWLVIPGISIVLSIPVILIELWSTLDAVVFSGAWSKFTTPGSAYYVENYVWTFSFMWIFDFIVLLIYMYLTYLFFTKNYKFPKGFIILSITQAILVLLSIILSKYDLTAMDDDLMLDIIFVIIWIVIWVPYMLRSKRVKNTFVKGRREAPTYTGIIS